MDGLIPLVYKAIKKTKTRRQYEVLSPDTSQNYNIADFYVDGRVPQYSSNGSGYDHMADKGYNSQHRRYKSTGDFFGDYTYNSSSAVVTRNNLTTSRDGGRGGSASPPPLRTAKPELVRFRSHRMFSCVSGS